MRKKRTITQRDIGKIFKLYCERYPKHDYMPRLIVAIDKSQCVPKYIFNCITTKGNLWEKGYESLYLGNGYWYRKVSRMEQVILFGKAIG